MLKVAKNIPLCNAPMGVPADDDEDDDRDAQRYAASASSARCSLQWSIRVGPDFDNWIEGAEAERESDVGRGRIKAPRALPEHQL